MLQAHVGCLGVETERFCWQDKFDVAFVHRRGYIQLYNWDLHPSRRWSSNPWRKYGLQRFMECRTQNILFRNITYFLPALALFYPRKFVPSEMRCAFIIMCHFIRVSLKIWTIFCFELLCVFFLEVLFGDICFLEVFAGICFLEILPHFRLQSWEIILLKH